MYAKRHNFFIVYTLLAANIFLVIYLFAFMLFPQETNLLNIGMYYRQREQFIFSVYRYNTICFGLGRTIIRPKY